MPLGHGRELQQLRPLARREKLLALGVGGVTAIVIAVLVVISLTHSDRRSGHGCIAVSLAYSMGGTQTYRCGAAARAMCLRATSLTGLPAADLTRACRRAGVSVG